jgi:glycosyltransferase involved in cell wall biosynthesis
VIIKGVARQWEGGGYYRIRQPLAELGRHGHQICCEQATSDVKADGAQLIVGQMIGGVNSWWRQLAKAARLVYELDDDPFEIEPVNATYPIYSRPDVQDSITHCLQVADLVTVSTEPLAERMRLLNPNVVVLQNRIDESLLSLERPKRDKVTIGWAGGGSHVNDIRECAYGLRKTLERHPEAEAHFIGADFRHLIRQPIRFTPWAEKTTDYYKLIDFDIGIAPLLSTRFAETKSHIKALEYAALGIPVIASDCAPYRDFVIDGVTGFLVRTDHEWGTRLRELVNDEGMRQEMGAKAREQASQWTIQQGWSQWESAYQSVL